LGLHPFFAKDNKDELVKLRELLKNNSVVAVGEIGLDYYNDYVIFKNIQKEIFYEQLCFAKKLSLPVIIHCRKAYEDLYKILKQVSVPALVFHSFSGSEQDIIRMNEFNSYFSFGLPITNENNKKHKRLIKLVPKEKILLETDSPFMKAKDAMCSYPADIINVYNASSDILGISLEDLLSQIERNVKSIWKDFRELSP
jgi:TatD DNase family protein